MERTAVQGSSNIRSVGHDSAKSELHVEFHSGYVYSYWPVSAHEHREFMTADSKGKHLHYKIKPNRQCDLVEQ